MDLFLLQTCSKPAVYLLVDSSPQGGKNLLNSEYDLIAADNVLEFLDERDALLEQGQSMIYHHFNIPVVLGSNHSTLIHEFVALQHAVFMEAGSSAVLANWNKHVVSTTTDRGTEKAFVRVPAVTFRTAFPFFLPEDSLQFEVDAGEALQAGQAQPDRMGPHAPASVTPEDLLCMDGALHVAGPMHALGNANKNLSCHAELRRILVSVVECLGSLLAWAALQVSVFAQVPHS